MKKIGFIGLVGVCVVLSGCSSNVESKELTINFGGMDVQVSYSGTLKNGKPNGEGSFSVQGTDEWDGKGTFENGAFSSGDVTNMPMTDATDDADAAQYTYTGSVDQGSVTGDGEVENMPMTLSVAEQSYEGTYTGKISLNQANGEGEFTFEEGDTRVHYKGSFSDGQMSGDGELEDTEFSVQFPDMDHPRIGHFTGTTLEGHPVNGEFKATTDSGENYTYKGEWKNDLWDGEGSQIYDSDRTNRIGHFTACEFTPTAAEGISSLGTNNIVGFSVSDENIQFINEHTDLFPYMADSGINLSDYIDPDLNYSAFIKSSSKYSGKLMSTPLEKVVQITEYESFFSPTGTLTEMITYNASNYDDVFYCYYYGSLENIYQNSKIKLIGLPVDTSIYDNIGGGQTKCIVMLLSGIG